MHLTCLKSALEKGGGGEGGEGEERINKKKEYKYRYKGLARQNREGRIRISGH